MRRVGDEIRYRLSAIMLGISLDYGFEIDQKYFCGTLTLLFTVKLKRSADLCLSIPSILIYQTVLRLSTSHNEGATAKNSHQRCCLCRFYLTYRIVRVSGGLF